MSDQEDPTYEVPSTCNESGCGRDLRLRTYDFDPVPSVDVADGRPDQIEPAGPVAEADCVTHGIQWSTSDPAFDEGNILRT